MLERLADELVERPPGSRHVDRPGASTSTACSPARATTRTTSISTATSRARRWGEQRRPGYNPGAAAEDQPETQALVALIERDRRRAPDRVPRDLSDGQLGRPRRAARARDARAAAAIRSSTTWAIRAPARSARSTASIAGLEVVTLESPYLVADEARLDRVPISAALVRRSASVSHDCDEVVV